MPPRFHPHPLRQLCQRVRAPQASLAAQSRAFCVTAPARQDRPGWPPAPGGNNGSPVRQDRSSWPSGSDSNGSPIRQDRSLWPPAADSNARPDAFSAARRDAAYPGPGGGDPSGDFAAGPSTSRTANYSYSFTPGSSPFPNPNPNPSTRPLPSLSNLGGGGGGGGGGGNTVDFASPIAQRRENTIRALGEFTQRQVALRGPGGVGGGLGGAGIGGIGGIGGGGGGGGVDEEMTAQERSRLIRRFKAGDVYAPNDLTFEELQRTRRRAGKFSGDVFDELGLDPLAQYKNFNLLSEFVTQMGRIKHSSQTGLRPANQRKVAKAVRRAIGIGLMPSTHKHPQILSNTELNLRYSSRS